LGVSEQSVRKTLITAGLYETPNSRRIKELHAAGMPAKDIAELLKMSPSSVGANLPYERGTYLDTNKSVNAMRIKKCREKKKASES
jgi:uncharacterized protein YjcR